MILEETCKRMKWNRDSVTKRPTDRQRKTAPRHSNYQLITTNLHTGRTRSRISRHREGKKDLLDEEGDNLDCDSSHLASTDRLCDWMLQSHCRAIHVQRSEIGGNTFKAVNFSEITCSSLPANTHEEPGTEYLDARRERKTYWMGKGTTWIATIAT